VADLISKPVMTGFLFGLGLTIALGQLPKVLGVDDPGGDFFPRLWAVLGELDSVDAATALVGAASIVALVVLRRRAPAAPGSRDRRCAHGARRRAGRRGRRAAALGRAATRGRNAEPQRPRRARDDRADDRRGGASPAGVMPPHPARLQDRSCSPRDPSAGAHCHRQGGRL
jgi:hypothetical protein